MLGLLVLALVVSRVVWRRTAGLPPWAEGLSAGERSLAHWTEKALLALLFLDSAQWPVAGGGEL